MASASVTGAALRQVPMVLKEGYQLAADAWVGRGAPRCGLRDDVRAGKPAQQGSNTMSVEKDRVGRLPR